jgi:hypothetical protein
VIPALPTTSAPAESSNEHTGLGLPALEQVEHTTEEKWMEDVVGHAAGYLE